MAEDELPPIVTRLVGDVSGLRDSFVEGKTLAKGYRQDVEGEFAGGKSIGEGFGRDIAVGIQDAIPPGFTGGPGERIGKDVADGIGRGIEDAAPDIQAKIKDPLDKSSAPAKESGAKVGAAFGAAFDEDLSARLQTLTPKIDSIMGGGGKEAGTAFAVKFGEQAKIGITTGALIDALGPDVTDALAKTAGDRSGFNFTEAMGGRVRGDLPAKVEAPIEDSGKKAGSKGGQAAGEGFVAGMSPLIKGALLAVAAVGPAAVLAGAAVAVLGVEALATKGNAALQDGYQRLGADASDALTKATEPLIPQMQASIGVLDTGIKKIAPELKGVFAAVAPDATAITGGLVSLVENVLPGMASGLRAIAPYAHDISVDLGKLGSGVGGFFDALGSGASGGTAGLNALFDVVQELLPDIGKIVGSLSNGLGPALHDIADVALPVAHGLADVVGAIPPGTIQVAAVATAALFAAFKIGTLTGIVAEGTTFISFLKTTATAEGATALGAAAATEAVTALGAAMDFAAGPAGALVLALGTGGSVMDQVSGIKSGSGLAGIVKKQKEMSAGSGQVVTAAQASAQALGAQANVSDDLTVALASSRNASAASAQQSATSTLAALGLTKGISGVTDSLYASLSAYSASSGAASAYGTVLDATFGKFGNYSAAEAAFTTGLANTSKELTHGKDAIDLTTTAGAANFTVLKSLSDLNETRAEKLLAETNNQDQANKSLQAGAIAIDTMARNAHFTKDQIDALNIALYGTKDIGAIKVPISADTSGATKALDSLIHTINTSYGTVQVRTSTTGLGMSNTRGASVPSIYDIGGWTKAAPGQPEPAVVHGGEYVLSQDMLSGRSRVDPQVLAALKASGGSGGASVGYAPSGGGTVVNIYVQAGTVLSSTIQFQQAVTAALAQQGMRMSNQLTSFQSVRGLKSA